MTTKSATLRIHRAQHHQKIWLQWLERHRRLIDTVLIILLALALLSIVGQLLYPADRALPLMRIGGLNVAAKHKDALYTQLDDYASDGEVTVKTPSRQWKARWQEIGLSIDREASVAAVTSYPVWERLIPFSSIMRIQQSQTMPLIALTDDERLQAFAEKLIAEDKQAASDAVITIKDGQVIVSDAKNGYQYELAEVKRQVQATPMIAQSELVLVAETVPYSRSKEELQAIATEAELLLAKSLKLIVADKTYQPDRNTIGHWVSFVEDEKSKKLAIILNRDAMKAYLERLDQESGIEPGTSTVTLLDGQEIARTPASAGRTVAVEPALQALEQQLKNAALSGELKLQLVATPPKVAYVRTYSQANSGLQALIRDWEATNYGDYGIVVREITGTQRYGDWQADKRFVTASTFKMFLAYTVLSKIQQGSLTGSQQTDMGWTVDACLREMIVNSTNPCAISLQNLVGWGTVDTMLHQSGFTATYLNNQGGGDKYSTVRDETNFLLRLNAGTLVDKGHTEYLLGLLKRQIWRAGIPSGVPRGVAVADKVGLYNGWVHDVAIVYGPKSTYILGIMSRGGSDPQFADLSRRVYNFFNQ